MNEAAKVLTDDPISEIAARAFKNAVSGRPYIIAVAGGSASGKTTLTKQLQSVLGASDTAILQQDTFQLGWDFAEQATSRYRWDDPRNYTPLEVQEALQSLSSGKSAIIPHFDLAQNRRIGTNELAASRFIIFEGLYSLSHEFAHLIDDSLYVYAPFYARFLRRVFRFMQEVDPGKGSVSVRHMVNFVELAHRDFVCKQRGLSRVHFSVPYDFSSETVVKFGLDALDLELPDSDCKQIATLPSGVILGLSQSSNPVSFYIQWNQRVVFSCEIDQEVAQKLRSIDWFSH